MVPGQSIHGLLVGHVSVVDVAWNSWRLEGLESGADEMLLARIDLLLGIWTLIDEGELRFALLIKAKDAWTLHELRATVCSIDVAKELVAIISFNDLDPLYTVALVADVVDEVAWFLY